MPLHGSRIHFKKMRMPMEDKSKEVKPTKCRCGCGFGPFLVGLVLALVIGWSVIPAIKLEEKKQPVEFNHVAHIENAGMACEDCHFLREDGTYHGLPDTAACAACHEEAVTENPEEHRFIKEYVAKGREIRDEWLVYQKQPDNVFFSHAVHSMERCANCHTEFETPQQFCSLCHIDVASTTKPPVYKENKISTYSVNTMKMPECEACHANPGHYGTTNASTACFVCHK